MFTKIVEMIKLKKYRIDALNRLNIAYESNDAVLNNLQEMLIICSKNNIYDVLTTIIDDLQNIIDKGNSCQNRISQMQNMIKENDFRFLKVQSDLMRREQNDFNDLVKVFKSKINIVNNLLQN